MQDFIGSVCRSLVFKPSDAGGVFGGFVEKIGSIIRKPGIGLFSKPPVPALPPIAKSDAINVKKDDAFGRVYMGLKEKRHFKEKMQQQSKKDKTKWKPLVRNRALKPSSLQLCMQMNEPDSNFGSKIWDPVGSDNTGSVNIWDYSDSEAAPASSWSTLPNWSLLCRPLPVDVGRCTCVIVKEALPEGLDGGNLYSLYTNTNKIRVELEEKQKQHARLLVSAIGEGVMKKMKEKDEQIQRMGKLNWVLQERVKSLYVENQLWRDLAQTNEAAANSLRSHLEQVLAHVSDDRPFTAGCGGGAVAEEEEDAESCCGSNDYGRDGEEVEVVGRRMLAVEGGDKVAVGGGSAGGGGEKRLCKKCGERESCVLVLPCRHLCLCTPCGSKYHHTCPVCNSYMNASVNVNLS